jgi:hypothetical protein
MDAAYLKENVNDALMEALTAVAVADPADKVLYSIISCYFLLLTHSLLFA